MTTIVTAILPAASQTLSIASGCDVEIFPNPALIAGGLPVTISGGPRKNNSLDAAPHYDTAYDN